MTRTYNRLLNAALLAACLGLVLAPAAPAEVRITPPKFGQYTVGDDYFLANYTQLLEYWNVVAKESDRIKLAEFGRTAEGRPMVSAVQISCWLPVGVLKGTDIAGSITG